MTCCTYTKLSWIHLLFTKAIWLLDIRCCNTGSSLLDFGDNISKTMNQANGTVICDSFWKGLLRDEHNVGLV
jgi:hypothetical protein